jgi:hypothetical protein
VSSTLPRLSYAVVLSVSHVAWCLCPGARPVGVLRKWLCDLSEFGPAHHAWLIEVSLCMALCV